MSEKFTTLVIRGEALRELLKSESAPNNLHMEDHLRDIEEEHGLRPRSTLMKKSFKELVGRGEALIKSGSAAGPRDGKGFGPRDGRGERCPGRMEKGDGEGSRGGTIIGHANGKPIYAKHDATHHSDMVSHHAKMAKKRGSTKDQKADHKYAAKEHERAKDLHDRLKLSRERGEVHAEKFAEDVHFASKQANFTSARAHGHSWGEAKKVADAAHAESMSKSMDGEGSRGGKVVGHTSGGKPIYASTHQESDAFSRPSGSGVKHHKKMIAHHKKMASNRNMSQTQKTDHRYAAKRHVEAMDIHNRLKDARDRGESGVDKFADRAHMSSRDANYSSASAYGHSHAKASESANRTLKKSMDGQPAVDHLPEVQEPPEQSPADRRVAQVMSQDEMVMEGLPFSLRTTPANGEPMSKGDAPGVGLDPVPGAAYSSFDLDNFGVGSMGQPDGNGGPEEVKEPGEKYKEPSVVVTRDIPGSPMVYGRER